MPIFNEYYTARHMLAKKAIFNLALSDRSDGKTYDCKFRMLEDFAKDGTIGLYVRRFKTEMGSDLYDNFYEEVLETPQGEPFREWEFKYSYYGVKVNGSKYFFKGWSMGDLIITLIDTLELFVRPFSLALRLFANILAGEIMIATFVGMVACFLPLPFMLFELFVALIQALVFALLSSTYITMSVAEEH